MAGLTVREAKKKKKKNIYIYIYDIYILIYQVSFTEDLKICHFSNFFILFTFSLVQVC